MSKRRPYIGPSDATMTPQQTWNARNPEAVREASRRYEAKRRVDPALRAARRATKHAYYERHKDACLEKGRSWAERNHDKALAQSRDRYWKTDPRQRFAWRANRKAAFYGRPDDVLEWETLPAGPWTCSSCGVACESWDHVEPLSFGGPNQAANLIPSCVPCNQQRTALVIRHAIPLKDTCKRGHDYNDPTNVRLGSRGERRCRACARGYASCARKRAAA